MKRYLIQILVILTILSLVTLQYFLTQETRHMEFRTFAEKILNDWQNGNFQETLQYWEDPRMAPPLEKIDSYEIRNIAYQKRSGKNYATVSAQLGIPVHHHLSGHELWEIEFVESHVGWIIAGCYESNK
ncbi:MAG: hypothetical protein HQL26_02100 [Candidatus Omnitrophica bacterium]|nr:hypothetical protein [Candidatus Omnitrophota bacterium]